MSEPEETGGLSVKAMVIGVMLLITYFCWATAASDYFGAMFHVDAPEPGMGRLGGRRAGIALIVASILSFVLNSLRLNHGLAIIQHAFESQQWLIVTFVVLMASAALFGMWVKKLEAELAGPKRKKGRRKKKRRRPSE